MNELINELYKKLDAKDETINRQALENAALRNKLDKIENIIISLKGSARYERAMYELDYILALIKEVEK